jgi:peptidoglycan/xylan/chitin deacetylase (PgdA/CDA1 family)
MAKLSGIGPGDRVALTFDDGPDPASTPLFLDELDRLGWRATFFVLGDMVERAPFLTREIVERGHEVALHGNHHRSHIWRSPLAVRHDLERAQSIVEDATQTRVRWFRPPHGQLSLGSLAATHRLDLKTVLWTTWGRDWTAHATASSVAATVRKDLRPGGTILLHDSDCTSASGSWRSALGSLSLLEAHIDAFGLRVVSVGDHLQV